jgi:putative phosphoribosyl transferase
MSGDARLTIVPGATHLFEEPGTLERVAALASHWFDAQLSGATRRSPSARRGAA